MKRIHPFIHRIRTERALLRAVNGKKDMFQTELSGLSADAITLWVYEMPDEMQARDTTKQIATRLMSIGRLTKLASNGSHRGAMIAPPTHTQIATELTTELHQLLDQVQPIHV